MARVIFPKGTIAYKLEPVLTGVEGQVVAYDATPMRGGQGHRLGRSIVDSYYDVLEVPDDVAEELARAFEQVHSAQQADQQ